MDPSLDGMMRDFFGATFVFMGLQDLQKCALVCKQWEAAILHLDCYREHKKKLEFVLQAPDAFCRIFGGRRKFSLLPCLNEVNLSPPCSEVSDGFECMPEIIMIGKDKCQRLFIALKLIAHSSSEEGVEIISFNDGECRALHGLIRSKDAKSFYGNIENLVGGHAIPLTPFGSPGPEGWLSLQFSLRKLLP